MIPLLGGAIQTRTLVPGGVIAVTSPGLPSNSFGFRAISLSQVLHWDFSTEILRSPLARAKTFYKTRVLARGIQTTISTYVENSTTSYPPFPPMWRTSPLQYLVNSRQMELDKIANRNAATRTSQDPLNCNQAYMRTSTEGSGASYRMCGRTIRPRFGRLGSSDA